MGLNMWKCIALLTVGLGLTSGLPAHILLPFDLDYDGEPAWNFNPAALTDTSRSLKHGRNEVAGKMLETAHNLNANNGLQPARAFGARGNVEDELLGEVDYLPNIQKLMPSKRYLGIELPDYIASKKELGKLKEKMMNSGK